MDRVEKTVECIKKYNPAKIIIFGSCARGESDEYSDLNFVVVKKTEKRFLERLIEVSMLIDNSLGKVDVFVYTPEEFEDMISSGNPFIANVLREGKTLFESR